jgi:glycerol-3-phosphate O-acyltransferase
VAALAEREILGRPAFRAALAEAADRLGQSRAEAEAYAARCLEEMAVHPEERQLDRVARLARFMISRSYDPALDINTDGLEQLKSLAERHPLIFLWSHKSHLDSFVFMRALYEHDFRPQPLSFAGINMNFPVFGSLAKRSGAIFLRRSFRDDDIYRLVFRHYIDYLVERRLPLSWSIEGTRSRTGKLNPPKLGLIQWVVDACRRTGSEDALLVPVSISFDQIAEIDDYAAMQRGLPKRKESLGWFVGYIRGMQATGGRIYVRFAEPLSLSDQVDLTERLFDPDDPAERIRVQKLAFEVCSRIEHATPIKSTDLLTLVLLGAAGRALGPEEVRGLAADVLGLIDTRNLPRSRALARELDDGLAETLAALTRTGLLEAYDEGSEPVWRIAPAKQLAAAYYRNTVIHYFLASAVAETALARDDVMGADDRPAALRTAVPALRDLLKFEFFFRRKGAFADEAVAYLDARYPGWQAAPDPFADRPPLFGHGILRSFIEAYRVLAEVLLRAAESGDEERLVDDCLAIGREMLLRGRIGSETALSKPLFANAVRLARHRGLVGGADMPDRAARERFAAETAALTTALARLQRRYDHAIGGTMAGENQA